MTRSPQNLFRPVLVAALLAAACALMASPAMAENVWLKVAVGSSGMAMSREPMWM